MPPLKRRRLSLQTVSVAFGFFALGWNLHGYSTTTNTSYNSSLAAGLNTFTTTSSTGEKQPTYILVQSSENSYSSKLQQTLNGDYPTSISQDASTTAAAIATQDAAANINKKPLPSSWLDEIESSLEPFKHTKISRAMLDESCSLKPLKQGYRVLIHNNQLYVHKTCGLNDIVPATGTIHNILQSILQVLCLYKLPNMELVMSYDDVPFICKHECPLIPLFSWSKTVNHTAILMPYCHSLVNMPWRDDVERENKPLMSDEVWNRKKPVAIWRGSTTGGMYHLHNWRNITRVKLVTKCKQRPDLCNALIHNCNSQCDPEVCELMKQQGIVNTSSYISPQQAEAYKYKLLMNGNSAPSSRSTTIFGDDALVLWQDPPPYEFFYSTLRPFVHYLPFSFRLEDLYERIEFAREYDSYMKEIVKTAQRFTRQFLVRDLFLLYFKTALEEYSKLLDFEVKGGVGEEYRGGRVWMNEESELRFVQSMGRNVSGEPRCLYWKNMKPGGEDM